MFSRVLAMPCAPRAPVLRPAARVSPSAAAAHTLPTRCLPVSVGPMALRTHRRAFASSTVCPRPAPASPPPPPTPPHPETVSDRDDGNFQPPPPPRTRWAAYTVVLLLSVPFVLEAFGIIDLLFVSGSPWPRAVRKPLREAGRAQRRGDFDAAAAHFSDAERAARDAAGKTRRFSCLARSAEEILTKLSALAVARGQALELAGRHVEAFATYKVAFEELTRTGAFSIQQPNELDDMRAVVLAKKLGDLASSGLFALPGDGKHDNAEESSANRATDMHALADQYYSWAVEHMLPLALPPGAQGARVQLASGGQGVGADVQTTAARTAATFEEGQAHLQAPKTAFTPLQHVEIPDWAASTDLGNAVESLASFFAASGHPERAAQLYNHAISLLRSPIAHAPELPSPTPTAPLMQAQLDVVAPAGLLPDLDVATKCHAGLLFYRLVDVLLAAADRPWREQGSTREDAEVRQKMARARALDSAREGLALVRVAEAEVGVPPSPDPVTTVGRGSVAPLSTPVVPPAAAAAAAFPVSVNTADECKLAEAGLLFALGRTIAAQTQGLAKHAQDDPVTGLYVAAENAIAPLAQGASAATSTDSVRHSTRKSATQLLSAIAHALGENKA